VAIALDRIRAIYHEGEKYLVLNIGNDRSQKPTLAQDWLEDSQGKLLKDYLVVTPRRCSVEICVNRS